MSNLFGPIASSIDPKLKKKLKRKDFYGYRKLEVE